MQMANFRICICVCVFVCVCQGDFCLLRHFRARVNKMADPVREFALKTYTVKNVWFKKKITFGMDLLREFPFSLLLVACCLSLDRDRDLIASGKRNETNKIRFGGRLCS